MKADFPGVTEVVDVGFSVHTTGSGEVVYLFVVVIAAQPTYLKQKIVKLVQSPSLI